MTDERIYIWLLEKKYCFATRDDLTKLIESNKQDCPDGRILALDPAGGEALVIWKGVKENGERALNTFHFPPCTRASGDFVLAVAM